MQIKLKGWIRHECTMQRYTEVSKLRNAVQVPKNQQMRLSRDVWLAAEAMRRHIGASSPKDGLERAFMTYVLDLAKTDTNFAASWQSVKEEGIQE